jgi:hypothetical protein
MGMGTRTDWYRTMLELDIKVWQYNEFNPRTGLMELRIVDDYRVDNTFPD